MKNKEFLNKLISLTFDEDPEVRKQAAVELAKYDDPGAVFALLQLTYDKDDSVKKVASELMEQQKKNSNSPELMSFSDIFKSEPKQEENKAVSQEDMQTVDIGNFMKMIDKIQGSVDKERFEEIKKKAIPTIKKALGTDKEKNNEKILEIQTMLTRYLDAVSGSEGDIGEVSDSIEELDIGLEQVSNEKITDERKAIEEIHEAAEQLEKEGEVKTKEELLEETIKKISLPKTVFGLALESLLASKGDEKAMKEVMKMIKKQNEKEIDMAFKMVKNYYKQIDLTSLADLKNNMRNVNTGPLNIKSVEEKEFKKSKKKMEKLFRILVSDQEGNEGVVYLPYSENAKVLRPGMQIKVEKGYVKTFAFSNETAITVKSGKVYLIL